VLADPAAFAEAAAVLGARVLRRDGDELVLGVATDGSAADVRALLDEVDPGGRRVARFSVHGATLDDVFLALTGHPAAPTADDETKEPTHV
jgi:ABC-2 type transport system ATP-binding protein